MKIDVYSHFITPTLKELIFEKQRTIKELKTTPSAYDLDSRFRVMDKYPDLLQVLTVPGATVDELAEPGGAVDLAKRANDEMAELIFRYPDRFAAGIAVLPMSDIEAALQEIDRAINDLKLRGILLRIPINGKPVDREEFFPVYDKMCHYNLPIFFHPYSSPKKADYPDETESKYRIWHLWGLVVETTVSMTRLVMSGVMERYPNLKIITHHCGAMVPYFSERIIASYNMSDMRNNENFMVGLTEPPIEHLRRFYTDTALFGNTSALMCGYNFYGAEHVLFATDCPFDPQNGHYSTPRTIEAIEQMDIPEADKKKIFEDNARKLLRLAV